MVCWFARDVTVAMLVVKNKSIFLLLGTELHFHVNSSTKKFYCIDPQHVRLVTWLQTKNPV